MIAARIGVFALFVGLAGCGASVEDVCQNFSDACADADVQDRCVDDGQLLEARATKADCLELFDDYLACVDDAACSFGSQCRDARATLETCVGTFPDDP